MLNKGLKIDNYWPGWSYMTISKPVSYSGSRIRMPYLAKPEPFLIPGDRVNEWNYKEKKSVLPLLDEERVDAGKTKKQQMDNSKWDLSYVLRKARFAFEGNHGILENIWIGYIILLKYIWNTPQVKLYVRL